MTPPRPFARIPAFPRTPAVDAAQGVLDRFAGPAIAAHSRRSWCWAVLLADRAGVRPVDSELLAVAALLHDIGLSPDVDAVAAPYETSGGSVAWVLGAGAGWPVARRERLREVIIRHNWPSVPADDPDGRLLEMATALDVHGARAELLDADGAAEVLAAYPRGDFARVFADHLRDQTARKPESAAGRIASPVTLAAIADHPHDRAERAWRRRTGGPGQGTARSVRGVRLRCGAGAPYSAFDHRLRPLRGVNL